MARFVRRLAAVTGVGIALLGCGLAPAAIAADPNVDAAVAAFNSLGLAPLTALPSGRTAYRSMDVVSDELQTLATQHPDLVKPVTAPYRTLEGRPVPYIEITNHVGERDGKPVLLMMGAHHGNEWPSVELSMEFALDLVGNASNPKVSALLDKVRVIVMPVVNVDGFVHNTRRNCRITFGQASPPPTCGAAGGIVDINRNFPFGWGANNGSTSITRGEGPGSEPEVKNVMDVTSNHQVTLLITNHTSGHTVLRPPLENRAGLTPDEASYADLTGAFTAQNGYRGLCSACDYETTGETIDWSYYATRGLGFTFELVTGGASPDYQRVIDDYDGTGLYAGHPNRNAYWIALQYAAQAQAHSVIGGTAPAGSVLKITKDFDLFTAPIKQADGTLASPQAIPTHLESSLVVPASGRFEWHVNPSVRPDAPYAAGGVHAASGFVRESWTLTCATPDGTVLETKRVTVDKGEQVELSLCQTVSVGGTVPGTLSLSVGAPASLGTFAPGTAREYQASTTANVTSTAGDAVLSVADASATAPGRLVNGTFALAQPLRTRALNAANTSTAFNPVSGSPLGLLSYPGPISNDAVTLEFRQAIGASEPLRTGSYRKALTFTLSTSTP